LLGQAASWTMVPPHGDTEPAKSSRERLWQESGH
jgi:hypothetical protein